MGSVHPLCDSPLFHPKPVCGRVRDVQRAARILRVVPHTSKYYFYHAACFSPIAHVQILPLIFILDSIFCLRTFVIVLFSLRHI